MPRAEPDVEDASKDSLDEDDDDDSSSSSSDADYGPSTSTSTPPPGREIVVPSKAIMYSLILMFIWLVVDDFSRKFIPRYLMMVCSCYGFMKVVQVMIYFCGSYFSGQRLGWDDFFANSDVEDF